MVAYSPVTLSASASGDAPLRYQWHFNGARVADALDHLGEAAVEGVDVEEGLRGVLVLAGAGVDDGDGPLHAVEQGGHMLGEAFHGVTHDDGVEILAEGADGVVFGLALDLGGGGAVADRAIAHADDLAGGGEREEGSRRGLDEVEHGPAVAQQSGQIVAALPGAADGADHVGELAKLVNGGPVELLGENDMEGLVVSIHSGSGGTRTHMPKGRLILSQLRLPISP